MALRRITTMKNLFVPLIFVLIMSACGSASEVGTGSGDTLDDGQLSEDVIPVDDPDDGSDDGTAEGPEDGSDGPVSDTVITNDVIVDPQITAPTEIVINPDNPLELWVRFVGGDPNCTAASVSVITETPDVVEVELLVGITEDALARSCIAGEFDLRIDVELNEAAEGKQLGFVQPAGERPVQVTPDLTADDFLGLSESEAQAIVDENLLTARTVRVDDEFFVVTEDFRPERLNFEVDDGVITTVTFG